MTAKKLEELSRAQVLAMTTDELAALVMKETKDRRSAIMDSPEGRQMPALASHLHVETDLSESEAVEVLRIAIADRMREVDDRFAGQEVADHGY